MVSICRRRRPDMASIWPPQYLTLHRNERAAGGIAVAAARVSRWHNREARSIPMLDVVYLLIGAVFLGACVLYAIACDHL
jgi:hypothetical protein